MMWLCLKYVWMQTLFMNFTACAVYKHESIASAWFYTYSTRSEGCTLALT